MAKGVMTPVKYEPKTPAQLARMNEEARLRETGLAVVSSNPDLWQIYMEVDAEIKQRSNENTEFYHRLGVKAKKVHDNEATFGSAAVMHLGNALGFAGSILYRAIKFAEMWSEKELQNLMERRTASGGILTWSHFDQLVAIEDSSIRNKLVDMVFDKDLSIRGLRAEITKRAGPRGNTTPAPKSMMGGFTQLDTMSAKLTERMRSVLPKIVFDPLMDMEADEVDEKLVGRIEDTTVKLEDLQDEVQKRIVELKRAGHRLNKLLVSKTSEVKGGKDKASENGESPDKGKGKGKGGGKKKERRPAIA